LVEAIRIIVFSIATKSDAVQAAKPSQVAICMPSDTTPNVQPAGDLGFQRLGQFN
jgi:hypothetical protein